MNLLCICIPPLLILLHLDLITCSLLSKLHPFLQVFLDISSLSSCDSYLLHSSFLSSKCIKTSFQFFRSICFSQSPNFRGLISAIFIMTTHEYKKGLCRSLSTDLHDHPQCLVPSAGFSNYHLTWGLLAVDSIISILASSAPRPSQAAPGSCRVLCSPGHTTHITMAMLWKRRSWQSWHYIRHWTEPSKTTIWLLAQDYHIGLEGDSTQCWSAQAFRGCSTYQCQDRHLTPAA